MNKSVIHSDNHISFVGSTLKFSTLSILHSIDIYVSEAHCIE